MKKQFLLLAGSAVILASCGSNNSQPNNDQAKIDSITKANAAMQDALNKQKNDSTINAMAKAKADSMELAKKETHMEGEHKHSEHKPVATPVAPAATPTVAPHNSKDDRFNTNSDGTQKPADPNVTNKKNDRFK